MSYCPSQDADRYFDMEERSAIAAWEERLRSCPVDDLPDRLEKEEGYESGWSARIIIERARQDERQKVFHWLRSRGQRLAVLEQASGLEVVRCAGEIIDGAHNKRAEQ